MDILEQLRGPHEWGYRGLAGEGFIGDDAPINAADEIERLRAEHDELCRHERITLVAVLVVVFVGIPAAAWLAQ